MYGANHATLGAAGGFLAGTYIEAPLTLRVIMAGAGAFGGLLSDIDSKSSLMGRFVPNILHRFIKHRGITHSLLFAGIVYAVAWLVQYAGAKYGLWDVPAQAYIPLALAVGTATHLFADGLTIQGVPLLAPLSKKRFRLLGPFSFRTDSAVEPAVVIVLLAIAAAYVLLPYAGPVFDGIDTPHVFGIETEKPIVFMGTFVASLLFLGLYSKSRSSSRKRRRPSKSMHKKSRTRK